MSTHRTRTLLLVEDEAILALSEQRMLERNGYAVVVARSGEEAVDLATTEPNVDLVLMDIDLGPGIDGTEAAQCILELREVPIVFLTSHTEPEYVDLVKRITGYGYVVKNSGEFVLRESIEMALELFASHRRIAAERERYKLITENMSETVLTVDLDFVVTYVSPSIERLTGFTADEYLHMSPYEVLTPESARAVVETGHEQAANPGSAPPPMQLERLRKGGGTVWTETTSTPLISDAGELVGYVATIRDISDRV